MTGKFEKISDFPDDTVVWYTFKFDREKLSEFELFDEKDFPEHKHDLDVIYNVIHQMMDKGAKHYFFRNEGPADALPRPYTELIDSHENDYGLRLYCIRLTDWLVVLLNGGIKTEQKPQHCPNVARHFHHAQRIAWALDKMLRDRDIAYNGPDCLTDLELDI